MGWRPRGAPRQSELSLAIILQPRGSVERAALVCTVTRYWATSHLHLQARVCAHACTRRSMPWPPAWGPPSCRGGLMHVFVRAYAVPVKARKCVCSAGQGRMAVLCRGARCSCKPPSGQEAGAYVHPAAHVYLDFDLWASVELSFDFSLVSGLCGGSACSNSKHLWFLLDGVGCTAVTAI